MEELVYNALLRLRGGDPEALRTIYVLYAGKVRAFARRLLGNEAEAEDVTQDVFERVWVFRRGLDKVEEMDSYLFRMTKNAVLNVFKHKAVEQKYTEERVSGTGADEGEEQDSTRSLLRAIDRELSRMPDQRRMCFHLSRYEKMSYQEIADLLGISPKTVQYHISRALADLREALEEER